MKFALLLSLALVACPGPVVPSQTLPDGQVLHCSDLDSIAWLASCDDAGEPPSTTCKYAQADGFAFPLACVVQAKNCEQARACK